MQSNKIAKTKAKKSVTKIDESTLSDELLDKMKASKFIPKYESKDGSLSPQGEMSPFKHYVGLSVATGATSPQLQNYFLKQLYALKKDSSTDYLNAALAFLNSMKPVEELEAMLIVQMFVAHDMTMGTAANFNRCDEMDINDRYIKRLSKLTAIFREHLDALNKHRGKGQQKVTVEHVNVHSGGQAIVGAVEGGGVYGKK